MHRLIRGAVAGAAALCLGTIGTTMTAAQAHTVGEPGDETMLVHINDSEAGGSYHQTFELAYSNVEGETPVYIYVPVGGIGDPSVDSLDPAFDQNPNDEFTPCADNSEDDYLITQAQIDELGDELADNIVEVDTTHFGDIGTAVGTDGTSSDALVMLVYNVQDESYYDCSVDTYTAGYFAPEYISEAGMNVIVVDAFDWANRIGDQTGNDDGQSDLYEGVIAHELEHLLMNYSDAGEVSWVDEGLADMAIFLNCYDIGGSHLTYQQVFHRETSLTRWGGGLENYGASMTYFLYLWEQAGGNGDGTYTADCEYDNAGGDLLLKLIFENELDGMAGVQAAINQYNDLMEGTENDLRSAEELFKDWAIAVKLDDENSDRWNIINVDFGDPDFTSYTVDIANDLFWKNRGQYVGRVPEGRWANSPKVPAQSALPFGVSYETFRNLGDNVTLDFEGDATEQVAPHSGDTHWWGGAESLDDNILNVDSAVTAGDVVDFWTWYFIEDGWDYGYVEALVNGKWVTVPLYEYGTQTVVTTNTNPHDNNDEGNGLTGTSGGAYFVDDPGYVHLQTGALPTGTTDVRFRYSTDAAYLDTGFFVDDVKVDGVDASLSSPAGNWVLTNGIQNNNWVVQILSPCDLTPNSDANELVDDAGNYVLRLEGDDITLTGLDTSCLDNKEEFTVVISNLTSGDIQVLDADYDLRVTGSNKKG